MAGRKNEYISILEVEYNQIGMVYSKQLPGSHSTVLSNMTEVTFDSCVKERSNGRARVNPACLQAAWAWKHVNRFGALMRKGAQEIL